MSFEPLRSWLRAVLPGQMAALGDRTCRLDFGSREVVLFDLRRLVSFLRQEFGIEITGLYVQRDVIERFAERELKLKLFATEPLGSDATEMFEPGADPIVDALPLSDAPAPPPAPEQDQFTPVPTPSREDGAVRVLPVKRVLRSGSQVRFDGDVHVYGDVNPGAHVVATGNILVFGALKGVAHAGAHGNARAFILAFDMRPTQLRIARNIAIPSPKPAPSGLVPEVATLEDDQLHVRPFKGRIPS